MLDDVLARIDRRLKAVGLAESTAAVKAGLSDSAIRNMRRAVKDKKNHGASIKTLTALAPVLKTTAGWLSDGTGPETDEQAASMTSITDVPHVSWVSAGQLAEQDAVTNLDEFPTISALDLPEGRWIALTVAGESMNKISPPGSIIFVNTKDKRLVPNGCYVVADEHGSTTYKRYRPNAEPPFQPVSFSDVDAPDFAGEVHIIGRVRRSMIDF